jgi:hypothetical protein
VRDRYRWLELIERRVEMIRTEYERIVSKENTAIAAPTKRWLEERWLEDQKKKLWFYIGKYGQYLSHLVDDRVLVLCENRTPPSEDWAYGQICPGQKKKETEIFQLEKRTDALFIPRSWAYFTQVFGPIVLTLALAISLPLVGSDPKISNDAKEWLMGCILLFAAFWAVSCYIVNIDRTVHPIETKKPRNI